MAVVVPVPPAEQAAVRVSNKILYIESMAQTADTTAYPLTGIVRIRWARYDARVSWAVRTIMANLALFAPLIILVSKLAPSKPDQSSMFTGLSPGLDAFMIYALLVTVIIRCWGPFGELLAVLKPYYVLSIETAGGAGTKLWNPDRELLARVAQRIADAIDDPSADWQEVVCNYHFGDNINQSGAGSIGKMEK